jgi:mRNA interferase HigB
MRIISFRRLREFWDRHREAEPALRAWFTRVEQAEWRNFAEVRRHFPAADSVKRLTVFNITDKRITY